MIYSFAHLISGLVRSINFRRVLRLLHYARRGEWKVISRRIAAILSRTHEQPTERQSVCHSHHSDQVRFSRPADPEVTIIIPTFNDWRNTFACLKSIFYCTTDVAYEIIIADDHSSAETADVLKSVEGVCVVRTAENVGFLRNCNHAATKARGSYLLLLNNDTEVSPNWLQAMLKIMRQDPKVGILGPKFVYPNGLLQEAGGIIWRDATGCNYGRLQDPSAPQYCYVKEVDYVSGACLLIRKSLWDAVGGFDERFQPAYYEDTDLAFSARQLGSKVMFQPEAIVVHYEGASHGTDVRQGIKRFQESNRQKFLDKWRSVLNSEHSASPIDLFRARDRCQNAKILLFIDSHIPDPCRSAGAKAANHYLQLLHEMGYKTTLMAEDFEPDPVVVAGYQQLGIEVLTGTFVQRHWRGWITQHGKYIDYVWLCRPEVANRFLPTIRRHSGAKICYVAHDLLSTREARRASVENSKRIHDDARKWERREKAILREVDLAYFFSEVEVRQAMSYAPDTPSMRIPLFLFDENRLAGAPGLPFQERSNLLFVGGFLHAPNADGVRWFIDEVFPLAHQHAPSIRLTVVGQHSELERKCAPTGMVLMLGQQSESELVSAYETHRIVLAPLRYGAGLKGKVIEALRYGIPVVTTTTGSEGIDIEEAGLFVADSPGDYASCILRLYYNCNLWEDARSKGLSYVRKFFSRSSASTLIERHMPLTKNST